MVVGVSIKVYYAAAMLGDRSNFEDNVKIVKMLEEKGFKILTKHVVEEVLDIEKGLTVEEVFERDIRLLNEADVLIADVSYPSLGVGFEVAYALLKGKRVYAICRSDRYERTSALIRGIRWSNFKLITYSSPEEAVDKLMEAIQSDFSRL